MRNRIKISEIKTHVGSSTEPAKQRKINPHFRYYPENERVIHKEIFQMFSSLGVNCFDRQLSTFTPSTALKQRVTTQLIKVGEHMSDTHHVVPDFEKRCFTVIHEEEEMPLPFMEPIILNGKTVIQSQYNFVEQR
jgi:uncharacterized protein (DUF111 family)